jgi:hypothetical protein
MTKEKFDSMMNEMNIKMSAKSESQKNTNCQVISDGNNNEYNTLRTSEIHDACVMNENLSVNKMLSVLIFLMLK